MIRFGCCIGTSLERIALLREAGFDYAEVEIKNIVKLSDDDFAVYLQKAQDIGLPIESGYMYLADGMFVNRLQADPDALRRYCEKAAERCHALGIQTIVYGSGASRRIPEGLTPAQVFEDIAAFLRDIAAPSVAPYGIPIAIEPLEKKGGDLIHTVSEAKQLSDAVGNPLVRCLADLYHMYKEDDPMSAITDCGDKLLHAHVAEPVGRVYPRRDDGFDLTPFLRALLQAGCPRVSVEAETPEDDRFLDAAKEALATLREAAQRAMQ